MTGLVRKATLLTACGLFVAAAAMAGTPNAASSSHQATPLRLIGYRTTVIDPAGVFTVTARDIGGNIIPGIQVSIKLGNCTDTHIADQAHQSGGSGGLACAACQSAITVDVPNKTVTTITNSSGVAVFDLIGAITSSRTPAVNDGGGPGFAVTKCGEIWFLAFNVKLDNVQVVAYDQNGANGVDLIDLSDWACDFYNLAVPVSGSSLRAASDYNSANGVDLIDLSNWAREFYGLDFGGVPQSVLSTPVYAW